MITPISLATVPSSESAEDLCVSMLFRDGEQTGADDRGIECVNVGPGTGS